MRDDEHPPLPRPSSARSRCRSRRSSTSSSPSSNWDLGLDWYRGRFDDRFPVRGESSPHYTNLPRFNGVAERIREHCPDARLIYMVRDPIKRILSHWVHATGAGYETRELVPTLSRARHRLRAPLDVLDAAAALPRAVPPRADRGDHARRSCRASARRRCAARSPSPASTRLHLRAVRPRVGEVERQAERPLPVDGAADQAAGVPLLRPQLRPPARVDALGRREGRPRPREAPGAEAGALRRASSRRCAAGSARTSPSCSSSPAASSPGWNDYT